MICGPCRLPRSLRHLSASIALANGALCQEVSRWIGHKPTKSTADICSPLFPETWDR